MTVFLYKYLLGTNICFTSVNLVIFTLTIPMLLRLLSIVRSYTVMFSSNNVVRCHWVYLNLIIIHWIINQFHGYIIWVIGVHLVSLETIGASRGSHSDTNTHYIIVVGYKCMSLISTFQMDGKRKCKQKRNWIAAKRLVRSIDGFTKSAAYTIRQ